ncbi:hypothetical protein DM860_004758 [Cuscuta australis]|uniref:Uncharacterized protein n=1 Tax=Cuscuta australis TaxID=267555 RepID=A0A328DQ48_9ASTE|nr:hypothetical protein DM860_004758 [Cuscuta australis]
MKRSEAVEAGGGEFEGFAAAVCNDEPMASQFKLLDRIKMRRSSIFTSPGILEVVVCMGRTLREMNEEAVPRYIKIWQL